MCWFLTAAVPLKLEATLRQKAHAAGLETTQQENASIAAALRSVDRLPAQLRLWAVTRGGCSCDLIITPVADRRLRGPERRKRMAELQGAGIGLRADARELLASLVDTGQQPVAFLMHTYGGTLDETFDVTKGPRVTPEEMRRDDARCRPDAIFVIRAIPRYRREREPVPQT